MHLHCGMDRKSAGHGFLFRFRQDFTGKVPGGRAGKDMTQDGTEKRGGGADQKNGTYRHGIVKKTADGAGKNIPERHHSK